MMSASERVRLKAEWPQRARSGRAGGSKWPKAACLLRKERSREADVREVEPTCGPFDLQLFQYKRTDSAPNRIVAGDDLRDRRGLVRSLVDDARLHAL
jgi:hypothetical protein